MHIGNLRTALYAYLFAKKNGGDFILRIEDTDAGRYTKGAVEIIYNTLRDVGLNYSEGPDVGGPCGPYVQSQRKNIYADYARKLIEQGGAYYCFCDKGRLQELHDGGAAKYDKHCLSLGKRETERKLAAGEPYVIRQNMPETGATTYTDLIFGDITIDNKDLEDNILIKSDGLPTYNFANVVDDHLMGITHVIRGIEYLSSTPKYNHLYRAFGWELPQYIHLQPIMKDAQHKLSKRRGDASYEDLLKQGYLKEAVINYIALLGWNPKSEREKFTPEELADAFSLAGISKSPSIFDEPKLRWLNAQYVKELPREEYRRLAAPWYEQSAAKNNRFDYGLLDNLLHTRTEAFSDIPRLLSFIDNFENYDLNLFANEKNKTDLNAARALLPELLALLKAVPETEWANAELYRATSAFAEAKALKKAALFWIMRIALSGTLSTPGGATELAELFGKSMTVERLEDSLARL
jgi:glutamyl-tRNA synthetase